MSNGEVIWDLSGNVEEWMKDKSMHDYGNAAYMSQVTESSHPRKGRLTGGIVSFKRVAKDQFGPLWDYTHLDSGNYGGLGYLGGIFPNRPGGTVIRGGLFRQPLSGVFATTLHQGSSHKSYYLGFRCIYHP